MTYEQKLKLLNENLLDIKLKIQILNMTVDEIEKQTVALKQLIDAKK